MTQPANDTDDGPSIIELHEGEAAIIFAEDGVHTYLPKVPDPHVAMPDHLHPVLLCLTVLGDGKFSAYLRDLIGTYLVKEREH